MKPSHLALTLFLLPITLPAAALASEPPSPLRSYVRDGHNLGKGGEPVSVPVMATAPELYMRSPEAWESLRTNAGERLGVRLSERAFRKLLLSENTRLQPCNHPSYTNSIVTAGITAEGNHRWFVRECHEGEQLIAVRTYTHWQVIASQGCWNPVWTAPPGETEALPAPVWRVPVNPVPVVVPGHVGGLDGSGGNGENESGDKPTPVPVPAPLALLAGVVGWLMWRMFRRWI